MRKVVDDVKDFFESYEMLTRLSEDNKSSIVKVHTYHNDRKQALNIKVIERIVVSGQNRRALLAMGVNLNDNLFCEFKLNYTKVKFTFKIKQEVLEVFKSEVKLQIEKRYKCYYHGTKIYVEFYNPKLQDIIDIFTTFEPLCKRVVN